MFARAHAAADVSPERRYRAERPWNVYLVNKRHTSVQGGTYRSSEPFGYLSHKRLRAVLELPAICFLLRSFIAAAALSAESSSIFLRGSCLTNGGHTDWERSKNMQLTHTARTSASAAGFYPISSRKGCDTPPATGRVSCPGNDPTLRPPAKLLPSASQCCVPAACALFLGAESIAETSSHPRNQLARPTPPPSKAEMLAAGQFAK